MAAKSNALRSVPAAVTSAPAVYTSESLALLPAADLHRIADEIAKEEKALKARKSILTGAFVIKYKERDKQLHAAKGDDFGVVNIEDNGFTISATTPKKVEWDQRHLSGVITTLRSMGEDPNEYVTTEYSVSEASYKAWPSTLVKLFAAGRTAKPGTIAWVIAPTKAA